MSEPLDQRHLDEEKEWKDMWQATTIAGPIDPSKLALDIAAKVNQFDRRIFGRNFGEYAAGAILFVWFGFQAFDPEHRAVAFAGFVLVGFVMFYLWWQHRRTRPLDPAADAHTYHCALLERYDEQVRLLRTVKYWYVLPLYALSLIFLRHTSSHVSFMSSLAFFVMDTVFFGFVIWLNEGYGVRKLKAERKEAESLLEQQNR